MQTIRATPKRPIKFYFEKLMIFHKKYLTGWSELNLMIRVNRYIEDEGVTASPMQCKIWPPFALSVETTDENDRWSGIYGYEFHLLTPAQVRHMKSLIDSFAHGKGHLILLDYDKRTAKRNVNISDITNDKHNIALGESFVFSDEVIATRANIITLIPFSDFFRDYHPKLIAYKLTMGK